MGVPAAGAELPQAPPPLVLPHGALRALGGGRIRGGRGQRAADGQLLFFRGFGCDAYLALAEAELTPDPSAWHPGDP